MKESVVIIPTYNEIENIELMVRKVFSLSMDIHLLVVDDNSPDGTADKVKELQKEFSGRLFIEERAGKLGLGTAYIHGFKWALAHDYDYVFEMDADFSHNPEDLPRLLQACKDGADMSVGSRYVPEGKVSNWPLKRRLMSYFASVYVRIILWIGIKDTTAGFVCYSKKLLSTINLDDIKFKGYAFQIEMKYTTLRLGFKISEVPITFIDRQLGTSKMDMSIFKEAVLGVLKMRFKKYEPNNAY
ncbi:MAG: dolichol-phosphate mannosyltransferase [Flavobacteriales bacterium]|jgi:dolichol-phosphate mannosyltransferase